MFRRFTGFLLLLSICLAALLPGCGQAAGGAQPAESTVFVMDTVVTQTVYGENAQAAVRAVDAGLAEWENRLSLFRAGSDIAAVNANAGKGLTNVDPKTAALVARAVELSQTEGGGAFAVTIAPLTLAWGVTGDAPRVVPDSEIARLLPLVNDSAVFVQGSGISLAKRGMALDLGGIAKGAACGMAADVYAQNGIDSALLSIGGNVYARGTKPGGEAWRVGFRDPADETGQSYIASFALTDSTVAVSGGYERFFEVDGERFIHILDPRTGKPAASDIVSVGVVSPDGAYADFMSTTLFVLGRNEAIHRMMQGLCAIVVDDNKNVFVSVGLRGSFQMDKAAKEVYTVIYVGANGMEDEDGAAVAGV